MSQSERSQLVEIATRVVLERVGQLELSEYGHAIRQALNDVVTHADEALMAADQVVILNNALPGLEIMAIPSKARSSGGPSGRADSVGVGGLDDATRQILSDALFDWIARQQVSQGDHAVAKFAHPTGGLYLCYRTDTAAAVREALGIVEVTSSVGRQHAIH